MIRDIETLDGILDSIRRFVDGALIPREHEVAETDQIPAAATATPPPPSSPAQAALAEPPPPPAEGFAEITAAQTSGAPPGGASCPAMACQEDGLASSGRSPGQSINPHCDAVLT